MLAKKLTAEFLGTMWLVLGGCGSAVFAAKFAVMPIRSVLAFWAWRWRLG